MMIRFKITEDRKDHVDDIDLDRSVKAEARLRQTLVRIGVNTNNDAVRRTVARCLHEQPALKEPKTREGRASARRVAAIDDFQNDPVNASYIARVVTAAKRWVKGGGG